LILTIFEVALSEPGQYCAFRDDVALLDQPAGNDLNRVHESAGLESKVHLRRRPDRGRVPKAIVRGERLHRMNLHWRRWRYSCRMSFSATPQGSGNTK